MSHASRFLLLLSQQYLNAPAITAPGDGDLMDDVTPTLTWTDDGIATSWRIQIITEDETFAAPGINEVVTDPTYTPATLSQEHAYTMRVATEAPLTSAWSAEVTLEGLYWRYISLGAVALWADTGAGFVEIIGGLNGPGNSGGVTVGQSGPLAGVLASVYDGVDDFTDIYNTNLNAVLNLAEFSWVMLGAPTAGAWSDVTFRRPFIIRTSGTGFIGVHILKSSASGRMEIGEIGKIATINGLSFTDPGTQIAYTRTVNAGGVGTHEGKVYIDAVQQGSTLAALPTWVGPLISTFNVIGAFNTTPDNEWLGKVTLLAWFNTVLTADNLLYLRPVPN